MPNLETKLKHIQSLITECLVEISADKTPTKKRVGQISSPERKNPYKDIDFSIPIRPFTAKFSKGLGGPKKFALLLARLVKGDQKKEILLTEIEKEWNKMKGQSLLGMEFNRFYAGQAKNKDWVESKKVGYYNLRPAWEEIFK